MNFSPIIDSEIMQSKVSSPDAYVAELPEERRSIIQSLRSTILKNLPPGFEEVMSYGMIGYVVPHTLYPSGYHCDPKLPLPFISIASQKNHITVYHMALYSGNLLDWFVQAWPNHSSKKLNMGKSCIRCAKPEDVPLELIGQLASKMTVSEWIAEYEHALKR